MKKRKIWRKMTALLLGMIMLLGTVPVNAESVYSDKISEILQQHLSEMEDDDLIMVYIKLVTISDEELDALILEETEYNPADYVKGDIKDKDNYDDYQAVRMEIKERENTARTTQFYDTYLGDQYLLRNMTGFIGTILVEIPKSLVLHFQTLDEVEGINSYKLPDKIKITNYGTETLSEERATILAECFIEWGIYGDEKRKPEEVEIEYFGTYSGYEVVGMSFWDVYHFSEDITSMPLGSYSFVFGGSNGPEVMGLLAFKDNKFTLLADAYEQGLITDEDVARLATNYPDAYFVEDDFYSPVLYIKTEDKIKEDYLAKLQKEESYYSDMTVDDLEIIKYYGNYNNCEVVLIYGRDWGTEEAMDEVKIGGYLFTYNTTSYYPEHFLVWEDGNFYTIKEAAAGKLPEGAIYKIAQLHGAVPKTEKMPYTDVEFDRDWFAMSVYKANLMTSMTGMDENTFGPYETLSRAQFATILYRLSQGPGEHHYIAYEPIFDDVAEDMWYTDAVLWAYENGIITGYENGLFGPADPITREQMAAMLYRYASYAQYDMKNDVAMDKFKDIRAVSPYAEEAIRWCVRNDIIKGNNLRLLPQQNTSRAECAAMITRFAEKYSYSDY